MVDNEKNHFPFSGSRSVAPVFAKVIEAKEYLRNSQASSTTEAGSMGLISRSVFYKYKDAVYPYQEKNTDSIITVQVVLFDKPGVLMALISQFYRVGANILTINQNIPVNGKALVSISARIDHIEGSLDDSLLCLRQVDGVQSIGNIAGE